MSSDETHGQMIEARRLHLHELHQSIGATFTASNPMAAVQDYGDLRTEYLALSESAGILDLSFRGRICVTGADRVSFLHGQVTNDVKRLNTGQGCYSAITTAKGKILSDLNIFALQDELLLDFEPGLTLLVTERLEKFIVSDDVQIVDASPYYGLLSVQGPQSETLIRSLSLFPTTPDKPLTGVRISEPVFGDIYLKNHPRLGPASRGFDLFLPVSALETLAKKLISAANSIGGSACGWNAFEIARIESAVPRFGVDMDDTNIASECGIESRAISYNKGCYIGQEVLNRIHSIGHVNRELRWLIFQSDLKHIPAKGEKLFLNDKEIGHITSSAFSPRLNRITAFGYVRREANASGTELILRVGQQAFVAKVSGAPSIQG